MRSAGGLNQPMPNESGVCKGRSSLEDASYLFVSAHLRNDTKTVVPFQLILLRGVPESCPLM